MIEIYNISAFAEAMLYYLGRANNERTDKKLTALIKLQPECKKELKKLAEPAAALEKLLDQKLTVDNRLVDKYFKNFNSSNAYQPFGYCLARIMLFEQVMRHIEYSANEMCVHLREYPEEERMISFCFGFIDKNEAFDNIKDGSERFMQLLEEIQLSSEDKWKVLRAAFNYPKHIDELLSLIMPAAEIISSALDGCDDIMKEFRERYSVKNIYPILNSTLKFKFPPVEIIKVAPTIFEFDHAIAFFDTNEYNDISDCLAPNDTPSFMGIYFGIAKHLISKSPHDAIPILSEQLKVISDNTRLELLFYLCSHRKYGQELCEEFGLQHSTLSYHITKLLTAGFIITKLEGGRTYYTADKDNIRKMVTVFVERLG